MKWIIWPILTILTLTVVSANSCLTSSEEFAVEVVVNEFNINTLNKLAKKENSIYKKNSEYNENLITIIKETGNPKGLSIKIQIPTVSVEKTQPHLKLLSNSAKGSLKQNLANSFGRWQISCSDFSCKFVKDNFLIEASSIEDKNIILEINEPLSDCTTSCSGICFATTSSSKCITAQQQIELDKIIQVSNISNSFSELLDSYRIIGTEEIILIDIKPEISPYIDLEEAMRQELVFLDQNNIINLEREDIEKIVDLTNLGQAGQNYRIVSLEGDWTYYDKTPNPALTSQRDCNEYPLSSGPIFIPQESNKFYYIVPSVFAITGVLLIVLLTLVARLIHSRSQGKNERNKKL